MERVVEEVLECPVCLDRFKEPKMLPCGHTFCLRPCLENIVQDNSVRCPECRACHNVPLNGVRCLPPNLTIVRFLDRSKRQKLNRQCKECKIANGDVDKCNHCDQLLCRSCIASHTRGLQKDLRHTLTEVRRLVTKLSESDDDLRERAEKLEANGRNAKCEISQSIERFISELQSRKKCLFKEVEALVSTETRLLQREQGEIEVKMADLTTHCQVASEICKKDFPLEGTREIQQFQNEIRSLTQKGRELIQSNEISSDSVRQTIVLTNRDENVVLCAISKFATVSTHALFRGESSTPDVLAGVANVGPRTSGRQPVEDSRVTEALRRYRNKGQAKKYFGAFGGGAGRMFHPTGICSTASDDLVVADYGNNRIQVFDVDGRVKGIIGSKGHFDRLIDVCVTSRGRIVVSDTGNHRIQILDERGNFVRTFGGGKLINPLGVATAESGLIYVCDVSKDRVQVFSEDGQFVREFYSAYSFKDPRYISVTPDGRVVVSERCHHSVRVFDPNGRQLFQLGTHGRCGKDVGQFKHPAGVATDEYGNIVVCDDRNNRVQVFTGDGEFVTGVGCEGSDPGQMNGPKGVCLLSGGRIAVCDTGHHEVQIF